MDASFTGSTPNKPPDQAREHATESETKQSNGLFQQVMEHSKATWRNVLHANASPSEYLEAGIEIAAVGVAARYGLTRFSSPLNEGVLKVVETPGSAPSFERTVGAADTLIFTELVKRNETRAAAVDRLVPVLSRRTLRYVIESNFPKEQL